MIQEDLNQMVAIIFLIQNYTTDFVERKIVFHEKGE